MLNQFSYSHNIYSIIFLLHGTDKREYEEKKKKTSRANWDSTKRRTKHFCEQ